MLRILAAWLLIVAALTPPIYAAPDDTVIPFDSSVAGSYLVVSDGKGTKDSVTVNPTRVVRPGPSPTPGPGPGPGPTPPGPTPASKAVMAAAQAVTGDTDRVETALGLAKMFNMLAEVVDANPATTPASLTTALTSGYNGFLANVPNPDGTSRNELAQWQPVRNVIGTYWTALQAQGAPVTAPVGKDSFSALLKECAVGLNASAPGKAISPELLAIIKMIIQIIMQLLQPTPR